MHELYPGFPSLSHIRPGGRRPSVAVRQTSTFYRSYSDSSRVRFMIYMKSACSCGSSRRSTYENACRKLQSCGLHRVVDVVKTVDNADAFCNEVSV